MAKGVPFEKGYGNRWEDRRLQESLAKPLDKLTNLHFVDGARLESVELSVGDNQIAHKLGRTPIGYYIEKFDGAFGTSSVSTGDAITLRQWKAFNHDEAGSPAAATMTLESAPEDGSCMVLIHLGAAPGSTIGSISQTGATWEEEVKSTGTARAFMWHAQDVSSAAAAITLTSGGTSDLRGMTWIGEFTGVVTAGDPWDSSAAANGSTSGTTDNSYINLPALTLTDSDRFIIGGIHKILPLTTSGFPHFGSANLRPMTHSNPAGSATTDGASVFYLPASEDEVVSVSAGDGGSVQQPYVFWYDPTSDSYAAVWGALKAATGGGSSTVTVPHGVRLVSSDSNFITLNSVSAVTVDMWVF